MKKKLFSILICGLLILGTVGCGSKKETSKSESENKSSSEEKSNKVESKGNCDVFECIEKADTKSTYEQMNELIGFEGTMLSEGNGWKTYEWKLNDEDSVEATFYSSSTTISIKFNNDRIKNDKVDFSKFNEVRTALNNRESVSYDALKEKFGGVDGTMTEKSSSGYTYKWVNSQGGYMNASLNKDKTRCSMIMGRA